MPMNDLGMTDFKQMAYNEIMSLLPASFGQVFHIAAAKHVYLRSQILTNKCSDNVFIDASAPILSIIQRKVLSGNHQSMSHDEIQHELSTFQNHLYRHKQPHELITVAKYLLMTWIEHHSNTSDSQTETAFNHDGSIALSIIKKMTEKQEFFEEMLPFTFLLLKSNETFLISEAWQTSERHQLLHQIVLHRRNKPADVVRSSDKNDDDTSLVPITTLNEVGKKIWILLLTSLMLMLATYLVHQIIVKHFIDHAMASLSP
jgi:type VI protein secretion system component VasF